MSPKCLVLKDWFQGVSSDEVEPLRGELTAKLLGALSSEESHAYLADPVHWNKCSQLGFCNVRPVHAW